MKARRQDHYACLCSAKCKMCQLTELLSPRKFIDFCFKSGGSMLQQERHEWLDIKLFHIKIVDASGFDREQPQCLTVHYLPRSSFTVLEVNGAQIRPSASAFVTLRRNPFEGHVSEASYMSTDFVRTTGKLSFEVYVRDETLICGVLERREKSAKNDGDRESRHRTWNVECSCALDDPSTWVSTSAGGVPSFPTMEVYVAGREDSSPFVLTCAEQLIPRRKRARQGVTLDVIPEGNDYENSFASVDFDESEFQGQEGKASFMGWDSRTIGLMCKAATQRLSGLFAGSTSRVGVGRGRHLSWVNAGIRMGFGMGLGMCVGFCIGTTMLVMRAYQGTTSKSRNNNFLSS